MSERPPPESSEKWQQVEKQVAAINAKLNAERAERAEREAKKK